MNAAPTLRAGLALALTLGALAAAAQTPAPQQQRQRRGPPPKVEAPLPPAPGEQMAAAAMAHYGNYECEFNERLAVDVNHKNDGYLDVKHRNRVWVMKPVLSHTGALRLEDVKGRMLMLQIANKSMLMDTQVGQRVVDNCVHEKQREAMAARKGQAAESIGIDPAKAAAAAAAASAASAPRQ
ncbi:MAG: hypothetical protein RJA10_4092 [Pseudomonadota bacterium]|jgi:hypothetical protein